MRMKIDAKKILMTLFCVFVFLFAAINTVKYFYNPYEYETVYESTVDDAIETDATVFRNEKVITSDEKGIGVYAVKNGSKVAKDAVVIDYFSDKESASANEQIQTLKNKIAKLNEIEVQSGNYAADYDIITSNVTNSLIDYEESLEKEDFAQAALDNEELFYAMCKVGVTNGTIKNIPDKLKSLNDELSTLEKSYSKGSESSVTSDYSGYFVNSTDGYESSIDIDKVKELSVDSYEKIKPGAVQSNAVGKVICDTNWYVTAVLDAQQANEVRDNSTVKVIISVIGSDKIDAQVVAKNRDADSGKVLVVLSCTNMNENIATVRKQKIKIVTSSYKGLKVNSKAVRFKDGEKGVYVSIGEKPVFRPIDIVYSGEDYVIVDSDSNDGQLKIYDDVIIKGKGLK